ncbi:PRP38 family protein [Helicosporidium sp. ATCC 50920]|nr:PRP38 family protein [Helicosporidium sp. ATCC 50920]|eukprot:KDD76047.1 PRP38 family protein [Helicosporidium sp. ATCC 50920]
MNMARQMAWRVSRSSFNRGFYVPEVPREVATTLSPERQERALEQYGNSSTFNFENVIRQNVLISSYYHKSAAVLDNWQALVDEIYYSVDNVEPWMSGNARGPTTAFNLLYRLCQLRPTHGEIRMMLDHKDSPYIRAIGFLYLRYVCNPRQLWQWMQPYIEDSEEFSPSPEGLGKTVSMGDFVRDILLDQYYFETIFPRIPKAVEDEIKAQFKKRGLSTAARGNAGQGGEDRRGVESSSSRPASVKQSLSVALGQRAPNRAGVRELGRGTGADLHLERTVKRRDALARRDPRGEGAGKREDDRERGCEREGRAEQAREGQRDHDRRGRLEDERDRKRRGEYDWDERRDYDREVRRDYDREVKRDYDREVKRDYDREVRRDYDRDDEKRRDHDRDVARDERREPQRRAHRDSHRDRGARHKPAERDARSVFRDRPGVPGPGAKALDRY